MTWAPILTPHGVLTLRQTDEPWALDGARSSRLEKAFARGPGHGLLVLGADEGGTALPPGLSYWRGAGGGGTALPPVLSCWGELAGVYVTTLCALPGLGGGASKPLVPVPAHG